MEQLEPYRSPPQSPDVKEQHVDPMDDAAQRDETEQRTTLTGKQIPSARDHDHYTSMMFGETVGNFGTGAAGANLLPPGYTDKSLVRIPIRESDLGPAESESEMYSSDIYSPEVQVTKKGRFGGLFKGLKDKTTSSKQKKREGGFQMVMMTRKEYLSYWAKDENGHFLPNVVEPPGGRRLWLKEQMEKEEEWIRENPSLAPGGTKTSGSSSQAMNTAIGQISNVSM